MTERQVQLLTNLIERYVAKAEPVSSGSLAERLKVSSATVRNDLAALEKKGLIYQPHTSAGRVPSLAGYRFYIEHALVSRQPTEAQQQGLMRALQTEEPEKSVAKQVSDLTKQAVLVAFTPHDFYYTGISKLFSQPEFQDQHSVISVSAVLDQLDELLQAVYEQVSEEPTILIGEDNPFSQDCALIALQARLRAQTGVLAVLGPLRVDYNRISGLLHFVKSQLDHYAK